MKQFSEYKVGDVVKLCEYQDMEEVLGCYSTEEDPVALLSLAECVAKICWLPSPAEMDSWDGLIAIQLYDASGPTEETVLIPMAVLSDDDPHELVLAEDPNDLDNDPDPLAVSLESKRVVRDVGAEHLMIAQLAVETIQNAYRNYGSCKTAVKTKKLSSTERMVHEMASDTIKKVWRKRSSSGSRIEQYTSQQAQAPVSAKESKPLVGKVRKKEVLFDDEAQATPLPAAVPTVVVDPVGATGTNPAGTDSPRLPLPPILHIDSISVANVPNIRWDKHNNDLYVELQAHYTLEGGAGGIGEDSSALEFKRCFIRQLSDTKWGAGEAGVWSDLQWKVPTDLVLRTLDLKTVAVAAEETDKDPSTISKVVLSRVSCNIMHSNLVRKHQLIGSLSLAQVELMEKYSAAHILAHGAPDAERIVKLESNLKMAEKKGQIGKIELNFNNHEYNVRLLSASELRNLSKSLVVEFISPLKSPVKPVLPPISLPGSGSKEIIREKLLGGSENEITPTVAISGRRSPETTSAQIERAEEELLLWEARKLTRERKEQEASQRSQARIKSRNNSNFGSASGRSSGPLKTNACSSLESALAADAEPVATLQKPVSSLASRAEKPVSTSARVAKFNSDASDNSERPAMRSKSSKATVTPADLAPSASATVIKTTSKKKLKRKKSNTSSGALQTLLGTGDANAVAVAGEDLTSTSASRASEKRQYCIIDKAFDIALQHCSADVQLRYSEVDILLSQVGIDTSMYNHFQSGDPCRGERLLTIPLHKLPLIQTLSEYIRSSNYQGDEVAHVILSKSQASTIIKTLSRLISGPWKSVRSVICQLCNASGVSLDTNGAADENKASDQSAPSLSRQSSFGDKTDGTVVSTTQQPRRWTKQSVTKFCNSTQLSTEFFHWCDSGQMLLQLQANEGTNLSLENSVVAAGENSSKSLEVSPALLRLRWNTYNKTLNLLNDWWSSGVRPNDKAEKEEAKRVEPSVPSVAMLRASPMSAPMTEFVDEKLVKISHTDEVLQALIPFNRAYGIGMNMTQLSSVASYVGGMLGTYGSVRVDEFMNYAVGSGSGALRKNAYKKCHWIVFRVPALVQALDELFGQLPSSCPAMHVRLSDTEMACLLPEICLRIPSEEDKLHMGDRESSTYKRTDDLAIGTVVDIAPLNVLKRAYERFDWWDKPDDAALESICGKKGEVVSIAELISKGRLGVHVVESDVTDAVPIEALFKPTRKPTSSDTVAVPNRNLLNSSRNSLRDDNDSDSSVMFIDSDSEDGIPPGRGYRANTGDSEDGIPPGRGYRANTGSGLGGRVHKPVPVKPQSAPVSRNANRNNQGVGIAVADSQSDTYLAPVESNHQLNMSRSAQSWLNAETEKAPPRPVPRVAPTQDMDALFGQLVSGGDESLPPGFDGEEGADTARRLKLKQPLTAVNVSLPAPLSDSLESARRAEEKHENAYSWLKRGAVAPKSRQDEKQATTQRPKSAGTTRGAKLAKPEKEGPQTAVNFSAPSFDEENASYVDGSSYGRDKASVKSEKQKTKGRPKSAAAASASSPKPKKTSRTKAELQSIINARKSRVEEIISQSREYNYNHDLKDGDNEEVLSPAGVSYREQQLGLDEAYLLKYNQFLRDQKVKEELVRQSPHSPQADPALVIESNESQQRAGQTWTNFDFPEGPGEEVVEAGRARAKARPKSAGAVRTGAVSRSSAGQALSPTSQRLLENRLKRAERADAAVRNSNMKTDPNPSVEIAPLDDKEKVPQLTVERLMNPSLHLYTGRTDDGCDEPEPMYQTTIPSPNKYPNNNYQTRAARETAEYISREEHSKKNATESPVRSGDPRVDPERLGRMERRSENDGNSRKEKVLLRELRHMYKPDE